MHPPTDCPAIADKRAYSLLQDESPPASQSCGLNHRDSLSVRILPTLAEWAAKFVSTEENSESKPKMPGFRNPHTAAFFQPPSTHTSGLPAAAGRDEFGAHFELRIVPSGTQPRTS